MSIPEVGYRLVQKANSKVEQYGLAVVRRVPAPDLGRRAEPFVATDADVPLEPYLAAAERLLDGRLQVFDREYVFDGVPDWNIDPKTGVQAPLVFGKALNYRDERVVGDIKYLWEINRHLELVALAQAYRLTADKSYLAGLRRLLESWLAQCPYPLGPNWTSALEVAIRLINWSVVWQLIGGVQSPMFRGDDGAFRDRWLQSIYRHMHFIRGNFSRFSSANNHLIGEAAGLYVGALTWPFWPATARWRKRARGELVREALRQNAPDGVNREQAIGYQQFVLDFLLLAALAGRANADDFPVEYWRRIERMLEFVAALTDAAGNLPMIGDADDGCVMRLSQAEDASPSRSLLAMGAVIYGRADFKAKARAFDDQAGWLLGSSAKLKFEALPDAPPETLPRAFPDGGYYILGRSLGGPEEIRVVADAGPLGYRSIAAHGHADALSFVLSIGGTEVLVDPGTYAYHTERRWRDYFRGTSAHNTIRVDGENQSIIGGPFMWTRHARVQTERWQSNEHTDELHAWHDGYLRLSDPVRHERRLRFNKASAVLDVSDVIECRDRHTVECFWHFAEDVEVSLDERGNVRAAKSGAALVLHCCYPPGTTPTIYRGDELRRGGWISRRFGIRSPTTTVVWRCDVHGTTRLDARIECACQHRSHD